MKHCCSSESMILMDLSKDFYAEHPFIYAIMGGSQSTCLFIGTFRHATDGDGRNVHEEL